MNACRSHLRPWSVVCLLGMLTDCAPPPSGTGGMDASLTADARADVPSDSLPRGDADDGPPPSPIALRGGPWPLPPGGEDSDLCVSWTLGNERPLFVNRVELEASPGIHHSNWYFVPDNQFGASDGTWPCRTRGFDQGLAAALGGVLFAQSTQATREVQQFPEGTVLPIPAHARIVVQLHALNVTTAAIAPTLTLTITPIARALVTRRLSGFYLEYGPLRIPPRSRSEFVVRCDLDAQYRRSYGQPLGLRFFWGLAHYHSLGQRMTVSLTGGTRDGDVLYQIDARVGDAWGRTMDPPRDITGATGIQLSCVFDNPRDTEVRYGVGDQEMCIWFGFVDSDRQWAARASHANTTTAAGTVDGVQRFTSPCDLVLAVPQRGYDL